MNTLPKSAISPLTIAGKLASAANLTEPDFAAQIQKDPRLVELLWFLQAASMQPGSLEKFAENLIADFKPHFGPAVLHDDTDSLAFEQRTQIWECLTPDAQCALIPVNTWVSPACADDFRFWSGPNDGYYPGRKSDAEKNRFQSALYNISPRQFREIFLTSARENLAHHLRSMCNGPAKFSFDAPWYCENLPDVLFEAMAAHAARIELQLARTVVDIKVKDGLDYAWQQHAFVIIQGDSRFGKTESVKGWVNMWPGRARLVSTPSSNTMRDLFCSIAEALGIPFTHNTATTALRDQIQYIIRHGGLFLVFDEAHFLLPSSYGRNTSPVRLDWLRTQVVDRNLPVAIVATPQSFKRGVEKFQRWTGHNFDQFFGRAGRQIPLPNELSEADLMAVCKIQGHDMPEKFHPFVVARAMQSEGYLKAIEAICRLARYFAARAGHPVITLSDVESAAAEFLPAAPAPARSTPAASAPRRNPLAVKRTRVAPLPETGAAASNPATASNLSDPSAVSALEAPARALTMPARETRPVDVTA